MAQIKEKLWTKNFILISVINLLLFFGFQMMIPTLPFFIKSFSDSDAFVGLATGITTLAAIIIRPFTGIALDRFGRKGIFFAGLFLMAFAAFSYSFFPFMAVLMVIRFMHGFAFGIANTAGTTIASDIIPRRRFGEGMSFFSLSVSLGLALAPALGLAVFNEFDFRITTFAAVVLVIVSILMTVFVRSPKVPCPAPRRMPFPYEKSSIRPAVVMLFTAVSYGPVLGFISLYAGSMGIQNIGPFFTVCAVSMVVTRLFLGNLIDRYGFNIVIFPGLIFMAAAMLLISGADSLIDFLVAAFLLGIGYASIQTALQTMSIVNAPRNRYGAANATFYTGLDAGIGAGSVLGGIIAGMFDYSMMYLIISSALIVAAALYFLLARNIKKQEVPDCADVVPVEELAAD